MREIGEWAYTGPLAYRSGLTVLGYSLQRSSLHRKTKALLACALPLKSEHALESWVFIEYMGFIFHFSELDGVILPPKLRREKSGCEVNP